MAQQVLTEDQILDLFWGLASSLTGLPNNNIRLSYPGDGQPGFNKTDNLIFISVALMDNPWDKLIDTVYTGGNTDNGVENSLYTRVINTKWIVYGPDAMTNADLIRIGMMWAISRESLWLAGITPVTQSPTPVRFPENINGQWYNRYDVNILYNVATVREQAVPYLKSADLKFYNAAGLSKEIIINGEP